MLLAMLLGFLAYGLSITFYILAQRDLGAARTSAFYSAAPFIGVALSWLILREPVSLSFFIALIVMLFGAYLAVTENHEHSHHHEALTHDHKHRHDDDHHDHTHEGEVVFEHSHVHVHDPKAHTHAHLPDLHHRHSHTHS